jgi:hypothetical protein
MRRRVRDVTTLALIASMSAVGSAWAVSGETGLGTWSGSLGLDYAGGTQTTQSANTAGSKATNQLFREFFRIANTGFNVVSPLLWTGNLGFELALDQSESNSEGNSTSAQNRLIGYSFDSTFLPKKPYTASVYANRNQSQYLQPFGGRKEGLNETRGASFQLHPDSVLNDWGFHWFESSLRVNNKSKTSIFGQSLETDETSNALAFNASKGFETADLGLSYQVNDHQNPAFSQGNFQSQTAGLVYSLDFGPNLNRRFDANSNYMSRNGNVPSTMASTNEHLHIDHYQNLSTDYLYGYTRQDAGGSSSTMQNGGFTVAHQLYRNLSTTAGLSGSQGTLPNGSTSSYGGHVNQGYHHSLPRKGNFSASWSGSYQLNSNNLTSSRISVIEEAHNAPSSVFDINQSFLLNHSLADPNSIVVTNATHVGPPLIINVDYNITQEGSQTRIWPIIGLKISAGDQLLVSYDYRVDQKIKYAGTSTGFGVGVDYRWLAVMFSHQQAEQTPLSDNLSTFLENHSQNSVRVSSEGTLREMPVHANMELINYTSNRTAYDQRKFSSTLMWRVKSNMNMAVSLNASETQYTLPVQHQNASISAHTSLDWYAWGGWVNSASADWSHFSDSGAPPLTLMQAGVSSSRMLGQLSLAVGVRFSESLRSETRSTDLGFNINASRRF